MCTPRCRRARQWPRFRSLNVTGLPHGQIRRTSASSSHPETGWRVPGVQEVRGTAGCPGNGARRRGARQVLCGLLPVLSAPIEQRPKDMGPRDGAEIQRQCRSPGKRLWRAEHVGSVGASRGVDAALHPACSTGLAGSSFLASCGVCPERLAPHKCLIHDDTAACSPSCQWEPGLCFP